MRHYTSRAGDPHRHLHLQINARVFAAGRWRGLHTVGVRDSLGAINGIGHAAVVTDPHFRAALAAHGYTLDLAMLGEIVQLAAVRGSVQCSGRRRSSATSTGYEAEWTAAHPGEHAGPGAAAGVGRPGVGRRPPGQGDPATRRRTCTAGGWRELADLGYRDRDKPVDLTPTPVGALDRDRAAEIGAGPARGRPVGVERRRHPRRGRTADRRRRRRRRRGGADRAGRGPHRPRAASGVCRCCDREGVPEHIRALDLPARARRRGRHRRAAGGARRRTRPAPRPVPGRAARRCDDRARAGCRAGRGGRRAGRRPVADRGRGRGRRREDHHPGRRPRSARPGKVAG